MSDDLTIFNSVADTINASSGYQKTELDKKNEEIGQQEFLTMLVAQLKNQDPMDPMKNEDFAVNLAQFSQLEQLIAINDNLKGETTDPGTMASYLGHQVVLDTSVIDVQGGDGGGIVFELPVNANEVEVELLDSEGSVKGSVKLGAMEAGSHSVALKNLDVLSGQYGFRIMASGPDGNPYPIQGSVGGIVNGFIPGPDPLLIVDGKEVSPGQIREVRAVA